ncbi:hypothetical protein ACTWP5_09745 [Streptomyces sp. 4N509B]|uniref:hypothetical protein n=1 Tax=Streptomyces sp. 4N509B TaxID=3457413 RepID=UPI003FCEF090
MTATHQTSGSVPTTGVTRVSTPMTPGGRPRRRWLMMLSIALLIAVPAGYIVLSAYQSRESGEHKARGASAQTMVYHWPSKVQRRIYDVPVPDGVTYVGHYETNSWERSTLYVQFRSTPDQLSFFLEELGTTRASLNEGTVTIPRSHADTVGWVLDDPARAYAGTIVQQSPAEPEVAVTVDLTSAERPRVYVASTTEQ